MGELEETIIFARLSYSQSRHMGGGRIGRDYNLKCCMQNNESEGPVVGVCLRDSGKSSAAGPYDVETWAANKTRERSWMSHRLRYVRNHKAWPDTKLKN